MAGRDLFGVDMVCLKIDAETDFSFNKQRISAAILAGNRLR